MKSKKGSAKQRHEAKSREWRDDIKILDALAGSAHGRVRWQAEQTLQALELVDPGNAEATLLRAHIDLDLAAEDHAESATAKKTD